MSLAREFESLRKARLVLRCPWLFVTVSVVAETMVVKAQMSSNCFLDRRPNENAFLKALRVIQCVKNELEMFIKEDLSKSLMEGNLVIAKA